MNHGNHLKHTRTTRHQNAGKRIPSERHPTFRSGSPNASHRRRRNHEERLSTLRRSPRPQTRTSRPQNRKKHERQNFNKTKAIKIWPCNSPRRRPPRPSRHNLSKNSLNINQRKSKCRTSRYSSARTGGQSRQAHSRPLLL